MATWHQEICDELRAFIERQHIFFVSTAPVGDEGGYPNVSPKGRALLRILGPNLVGYLDYPGSGNETARHIGHGSPVTLMFCSFERETGVVRLFGRGRVVPVGDPELERHREAFAGDFHPYVRQAFFVDVEKAWRSCGYGVPRTDFLEDRDTIDRWCERALEPREMAGGLPQPGELRLKK